MEKACEDDTMMREDKEFIQDLRPACSCSDMFSVQMFSKLIEFVIKIHYRSWHCTLLAGFSMPSEACYIYFNFALIKLAPAYSFILHPRIRSNKKMNMLFYLCSQRTERSLYEISCFEAAAFITFAESGAENPCVQWLGLAPDDRKAWFAGPHEDVAGMIFDMPDYREQILYTGWPVLTGHEFLYRPVWRPPPNSLTISLKDLQRLQDLMDQHLKEHTVTLEESSLQGDLAKHIIDIHQYQPFAVGQPLDQGQIMHGLCKIIEERWGKHWAQDIMVVSWSVAHRSDYASLLKHRLRLVFGVLHDSEHWALFVWWRKNNTARVYDGLSRPGIAEAATEMESYLTKTFGGRVQREDTEVPLQPDSWSCGQRVLLYADWVFQSLEANGWNGLPGRRFVGWKNVLSGKRFSSCSFLLGIMTLGDWCYI